MTSADQKRTWRISARLKQARAASQEKLSQSELARRVQERGLPKFVGSHASRLELGYTYATWSEVEAIAAVLEVSADWLAGNEETKSFGKGLAAAASSQTADTPEKSSEAAVPRKAVIADTLHEPETRVSEPQRPAPASAASAPALEISRPATQDLAPLVIPTQGSLPASDYRLKLGVERRKAEEILARPGLSAAEWRQHREYVRALTEVLRTLVG